MKSTPPAHQSPMQQQAPLAVAAPADRKSTKVSVWDFAKSSLILALITKSSFLVGYLPMRYISSSRLPKSLQSIHSVDAHGRKQYPLAQVAGAITGLAGVFYELWDRWRKIKSQQLGVKDIHTDIFTEFDPKLMSSEVAQNSRIQEGIKALVEEGKKPIEPRGTFSDALKKENSSPALQH